MKEQLVQYVNLLFAGTENTDDMKQEILQNTLERYDDLIAQGKAPQAAYQLSIAGIGDINELLGRTEQKETEPQQESKSQDTPYPVWKRVMRAVAICLYIVSVIPLIALEHAGLEELGLCGTLAIVAVATAILIFTGNKHSNQETNNNNRHSSELEKAIHSIVLPVGLCIYFIISFITQAWYITWVIFPIMAAVQGLIKAVFDLKGANSIEN